MNVQLLTLDAVRERMDKLDRARFSEQFPGAFLLAMGFLSVEAIKAGQSTAEAMRSDTRDSTAAITFGARLRHDVERHPLAGCAFYLQPTCDNDRVDVGRSPRCGITIPDNGVSEQHCSIEVTIRGVVVIDQGSTNGTSVNLRRLEQGKPQVLADEDILSLGRYSFQLLSVGTFYDELALLSVLDANSPPV